MIDPSKNLSEENKIKYQMILQEMARQGTICIRVKLDKPSKHSDLLTGTIDRIHYDGIGVLVDGMNWNTWFRLSESHDKRSRYIRELSILKESKDD